MTVIDYVKWRNITGIQLENDIISVVVLPSLGGKISSIYHKKNPFELVAQNENGVYKLPTVDADFSQFDTSGIDDAFPSIHQDLVELNGSILSYPDHGEIWSHPLRSYIHGECLVLQFESERFSYTYEKRITLSGQEVQISYRICNLDDEPLPCLWAFHGLMRYEEDMHFIYPDEVKEFVNVFDSKQLGEIGTTFSRNNERYDFSRVPSKGSNTMIKYYVQGKVSNGVCAYYYPSQNMQCLLTYDAEKLPYLGVWITTGGFKGDFNCAIEPSNGFYDTIQTAKDNNALYFLKKREPLEFSLRLSLQEIQQENP